jgi:hypothetical protein
MLFALVCGAACSTPDTETSVFLEIYDGTVVSGETDVSLDVFDAAGGGKIATLNRTAPSQTSASAPLGSLVILAGADAGVGTLRIQGQRLKVGVVLSEGSVEVSLVTNRQVNARLALVRRGGQADAGGVDLGGGADTGRSGDVGSTPADAGTPPTDAGTPPTDSGGGTLLANGDSCRSGSACNSGFCTDGVCCDSACGALCHGCDLIGSRGTCKAFSAGSQCVSASCTSNDGLIPARTCDGNGNCGAAGATQSCGNYRCQNNACLTSCSSSLSCILSARCFNNRCG